MKSLRIRNVAKPEQEAVANESEGSPCPEFWDWLPKAYNFVGDGIFTKYNMEVAFLAGKQFSYTSPPRQEWVGLTDEEKTEIFMQAEFNDLTERQMYDVVEAKLKEKNT